jgi:putative ubiquitin-RnfH superfamily antitoxin RatB of RatAB toxin-antitoxin module
VRAEAPGTEVARAEVRIQVELAWSPRAGEVQLRTLTLPQGATIADAIAEAVTRGVWDSPPELAPAVWGRARDASHPLREGDRLELLRPLAADPKEARRRRHRGARQAKK